MNGAAIEWAESRVGGSSLARKRARVPQKRARGSKADLKGCNFSGADTKDTRFNGARYDRFTVPPAKFDYQAHGMVEDE